METVERSHRRTGDETRIPAWTAEEVQDWIYKTLRSRVVSGPRSLAASKAFSDINGQELVDLVHDHSHGLFLENKLRFLGLNPDIVDVLAPEISKLVGPPNLESS